MESKHTNTDESLQDSNLEDKKPIIKTQDEFNQNSESLKKKFLGGYRNKLTGQIYHHATIQTDAPPWERKSDKPVRDAHTSITNDQYVQTPRSLGTQVQYPYCFKYYTHGKILPANEIPRSEYFERNVAKLVTLQKYIRGWIARKEYPQKRLAWLSLELEEPEPLWNLEEEVRERMANPKTWEDFKLVYNKVQKWCNDEAQCLSSVVSGADLKAAKWLLLNAEAKKIADVDRLKATFEAKQGIDTREACLKTAAKLHVWKAYKGTIRVDTPGKRKAQSLYDLYLSLSVKNTPKDERIPLLNYLKEVLESYHGKLTRNLIQLANREIDLLHRGMKLSQLEGLRIRIRDLFWQYAKQPVHNPEMQRLLKLDPSRDSKPSIVSCASCHYFFSLPQHPGAQLECREGALRCKRCVRLESEIWIRRDIEVPRKMLSDLTKEEERRPDVASILLVLRPTDIKHLVETIWKSQSCLSGPSKAEDLKLIRFDPKKSWSPWNCLLVTRKEAYPLDNIHKRDEVHEKKFLKAVLRKHAAAKQHFSTIPRFFPYLKRANKENKFPVSSDGESD